MCTIRCEKCTKSSCEVIHIHIGCLVEDRDCLPHMALLQGNIFICYSNKLKLSIIGTSLKHVIAKTFCPKVVPVCHKTSKYFYEGKESGKVRVNSQFQVRTNNELFFKMVVTE